MRQWNVDCSSKATLSGGEHNLWHKNKKYR